MIDQLTHARATSHMKLALIVSMMMLTKKLKDADDAMNFVRENTEDEAGVIAVSLMVKDIMTRPQAQP
jgi:hypothetical protein